MIVKQWTSWAEREAANEIIEIFMKFNKNINEYYCSDKVLHDCWCVNGAREWVVWSLTASVVLLGVVPITIIAARSILWCEWKWRATALAEIRGIGRARMHQPRWEQIARAGTSRTTPMKWHRNHGFEGILTLSADWLGKKIRYALRSFGRQGDVQTFRHFDEAWPAHRCWQGLRLRRNQANERRTTAVFLKIAWKYLQKIDTKCATTFVYCNQYRELFIDWQDTWRLKLINGILLGKLDVVAVISTRRVAMFCPVTVCDAEMVFNASSVCDVHRDPLGTQATERDCAEINVSSVSKIWPLLSFNGSMNDINRHGQWNDMLGWPVPGRQPIDC